MNIKIIGGGIAGLASALAVANAGGKATIFEKSASFEPVGAGLQLGPNAARALQSLGAWDAVKPYTYAPPELHIRDGRNGKIIKRLALGKPFEVRYAMPYRTAHRSDLHHALLEVASSKSNIEIQTNVEVDDLLISTFDGIIAADGVWSKSRQNMFPDTAAIITKDTYYRNLISLPLSFGNVELGCVNLWLYSGGHVVHYPVGVPAKLNLVAITNGQDPRVFFKDAHADLQSLLALGKTYTKWPSAYVPFLQHWQKGNITLIGDAAHGTLPYLAQGAAMALEDAANLQSEIGKSGNFAQATRSFEQNRIARTTRLHIETQRARKAYHLGKIFSLGRNLFMRISNDNGIYTRLDWIYRSSN